MNDPSAFAKADLVRRIRAGDERAFEVTFRTHYAQLCDFANSIVQAPDVAEEVVQDVFANLWRGRAALQVTATLRAYLYGAVRNRALNHWRRSVVEVPVDSLAEPRAPDTDAQAALESGEVRARVLAALESLPPRNREVLVLRWLHGLSHAEIAATLGISRKGVENHLARGLAALRDRLPPHLF